MEQITSWYQVVGVVQSHVVKISTPRGSGTGFLIYNGRENPLCWIATAAHVVENAHYWEEPIRIEHVSGSLLLRQNQRVINLDPNNHDTAAVGFDRGSLQLPIESLPLTPTGQYFLVGSEIGWLGYPAVASSQLCFFGGKISAVLQNQDSYLVDGVVINGVSGGPAFTTLVGSEGNPITIMGVVSAYAPNRATGETLPGLGVVRNVSQFQNLVPTIASFDKAKEQETKPAAPPPPPLDTESGGAVPTRHTTS